METGLQRRLFTVDEFHRMGEIGILSESDRVELVDGEVRTMTPIGTKHAACVRRLTMALSRLPGSSLVSVQNPVRLDVHSELQPDIALLQPRPDAFAGAHPGPADVILIIEVVDTTGRYDREIKLPVYARAALPEVWLVDVLQDRIEVYTRPSSRGYDDVQHVARGERVHSTALPHLELAAEDILGRD